MTLNTITNQIVQTAKISPVEIGFEHTVHSYQGLCPWDRSGKRLVFLAFDSGKKGAIIVRNLQSGNDQIVGYADQYNYHCAAWQQWALGDSAIVYRSGTQSHRFSIADLDTHVTRPCGPQNLQDIRQMTVDGRRAYVTVCDDTLLAAGRMDIATGRVETLLTKQQAVAVLPPELRDPEDRYTFSHPVANATETLLFVKFEKLTKPWGMHPNGNENWGAFLVLDMRSGKIHCLGNRISGHPQWMPDHRHIVNIKKPLDGSDNRWLVSVDSITGEDQRLIDLPIEGAGHPVISPDGQWIATDAYTANGEQCPIYLVHIPTGRTREIARLRHRVKAQSGYDPTTILRANPHPVWSPDGTKLLVNCNHDGKRMQLLILSDFLVHKAANVPAELAALGSL